MNEVDSGSGNGAEAASTVPAESPAATATPAPAGVSADQVKGLINETLTGFKNSFFAEMRKAGMLKQEKAAEPAPAPSAQPTTSAPSAHAGLSAADLDARFELERVIASREAKHELSEAQARRLRSALSGVSRDALASEADSYLSDLGLVKAATPPPQPATPATPAAQPAAKPNISDRGTAAPTDMRDSEGVLHSRPLEMTGHDVDELILKHGPDKGMQMFQERVLAALSKVRIKSPRG